MRRLGHLNECILMRTNVVLDDDLVTEAFKYSSAKTKRQLIHEALLSIAALAQRRVIMTGSRPTVARSSVAARLLRASV